MEQQQRSIPYRPAPKAEPSLGPTMARRVESYLQTSVEADPWLQMSRDQLSTKGTPRLTRHTRTARLVGSSKGEEPSELDHQLSGGPQSHDQSGAKELLPRGATAAHAYGSQGPDATNNKSPRSSYASSYGSSLLSFASRSSRTTSSSLANSLFSRSSLAKSRVSSFFSSPSQRSSLHSDAHIHESTSELPHDRLRPVAPNNVDTNPSPTILKQPDSEGQTNAIDLEHGHTQYCCTTCAQSFVDPEKWEAHEKAFLLFEETEELLTQSLSCFDRGPILTISSSLVKSAQARIGRVRRQHLACGFCSCLHDDVDAHLYHLAYHYWNRSDPEDWSHSRVIQGLLRQPVICDAWDECKAAHPVLANTPIEQIKWRRCRTGRIPRFAILYGNVEHLQDALELFDGSREDAKRIAHVALAESDTFHTNFQYLDQVLVPLHEVYGHLCQLEVESDCHTVEGKLVKLDATMGKAPLERTEPLWNGTPDGQCNTTASKPAQHLKSNQEEPIPGPSSALARTRSSLKKVLGSKVDALQPSSETLSNHIYESIVSQVTDSSIEDMISQVMEEFWLMWSQNWQGLTREIAGGRSSPAGQIQEQDLGKTQPNNSSALARAHENSKRRRSEDDANDDGDGEGSPPPPDRASRTLGAAGKKFACPFPSGWQTTARLKEHLYRCHRPIYCQRCKQIFKSKPGLDAHVSVARENICDAKPGPPPEGLSPEQEQDLRSRKKSTRNQSEVSKWCGIYNIIFPNEAAPSPYFEPIDDGRRQSPDSHELEELEGYLRQQVPSLVQSTLTEAARRDRQLIQAQLLSMLHQVTKDCIEQACLQFRKSRHTDSQHLGDPAIDEELLNALPDLVLANHANMSEPDRGRGIMMTGGQTFVDVDQEGFQQSSSAFLDRITNVPPALDGDYAAFDGPDTSLDRLANAELSDSGYGKGGMTWAFAE
ncbi:uncharacterized protein E0L32_009071 [Thyridium curvatum]|uniref:C2H2-type domain-containing protein n=1 Tax=Thyridium curvatum TaxID=1093900 RepID=A0A507AJU2_9PEZI|nr:uncharacterized protein E0L32_009071 [Thyridium curvatum]TPX09732.1 hypothetical protein E0L32_009071 [Thyridium curvatum]